MKFQADVFASKSTIWTYNGSEYEPWRGRICGYKRGVLETLVHFYLGLEMNVFFASFTS